MNYSTFASESVCAGHPDKICDQISDAILDAAYQVDPFSRVAVETLVTQDHVTIAGEVTCPQLLDYRTTAKKVISDLGYTNSELGFSFLSPIDIFVHEQSPDISQGVNHGGAGDQGMMFGYAVAETPELMPLPIMLAHALCQKMDELKIMALPYLRPDGKSEVSVRYENGQPVAVEAIILAAPHDPNVDREEVRSQLYRLAVVPVLQQYQQKIISKENVILNGTGKWAIGGPASDTGVTGRKIIVDSYGGMARIGGGCFSGKDVTKVDRSAAYGARFIAKNIVAAGLAHRCEVQVAYVIGQARPIVRAIDTFGTGTKPSKEIEDFAWGLLDMSTGSIIEKLNLRQPIYRPTARYGHFGHPEYPWEKTTI